MDRASEPSGPWYAGITRQQWLVLVIASLGWVFDVFEGQIFVASEKEAMPALLPAELQSNTAFYTNLTFAAFLLGGALGGVLFGRLSDRIGRSRTLIYTILVYSACTCLSALSQTWWHMAAFRFLVALGTGGEWAVASALVAEVFPSRARARSLAIFHASSVLGTFLAIGAGLLLVANPAIGWRWAFVVGAAPALLVLWVRWSIHDPQKQVVFSKPAAWRELFRGDLLHCSLVGVGLATVGLATFWGVHIYGKNVLRAAVSGEAEALKQWEMLGMLLVTIGGGIGLVSFGPLADRWGRRGAFLAFHLGGLAASLVLFQLLSGMIAIILFLPVFGFLTLGMHAGYAVYFPELFPTALRGVGAGFCFNVGRVLAAPILFVSGWLQRADGAALTLDQTASLLSLLFLVGVFLLIAAPETRGRELPL